MILPPLPRAIMCWATACIVKKQALHIHAENLVVARLRHLDDRRHIENRRIVDENVDAAPKRNDIGDHAIDRGAFGDIDFDAESLVAEFRGDILRLPIARSAMATRAPSAI